MKTLRASWKELAARYNALLLRERRLVAAVAVLGPLLIGNALLVDPSFSRAKRLRQTVEQQQVSISDLKAQVANLQMQVQTDPDAGKKAELAGIKEQVAGAGEHLKQLQNTLVAPEEMNGLLERLLNKHAGLRLISLKTLPPESIFPALAAPDGKPAPVRQFDIYKHGVELRLEGSYLELMAYIDQLEKADKKLLWGPLQFSVVDHPRSQLTVIVYTLSVDKAWLAI